VLDPDGNEKTELMAALVRPFPERVAGTPTDYSYDESTRTFTMHFSSQNGATQPTIISTPSRIWGGLVNVECGGCQSSVLMDHVELSSTHGDVTVVLKPNL